ncbi:MAG: hypothetical protein M0P19_14155, partial [Nevskia sp.]|nr:hypothetical protein [Nevskia sp.]
RRCTMHFTPTYSFWLSAVELWFAKIEHGVIARGIFAFATDLKRRLVRYIRHDNSLRKPIKWKCFGPARGIAFD